MLAINHKAKTSPPSSTFQGTIMATISMQTGSSVLNATSHQGLERVTEASGFLKRVFERMIAAQEAAAMRRLARYHHALYVDLVKQDHRLAEEFFAAKSRSEA
jgi:tellurite resistance protein